MRIDRDSQTLPAVERGERLTIEIDGQPVELTAKEFDLLLHFARHPGRVYSRGQLLDHVWGYSHNGYEHTVNSHINRLRKKLEKNPKNIELISELVDCYNGIKEYKSAEEMARRWLGIRADWTSRQKLIEQLNAQEKYDEAIRFCLDFVKKCPVLGVALSFWARHSADLNQPPGVPRQRDRRRTKTSYSFFNHRTSVEIRPL